MLLTKKQASFDEDCRHMASFATSFCNLTFTMNFTHKRPTYKELTVRLRITIVDFEAYKGS